MSGPVATPAPVSATQEHALWAPYRFAPDSKPPLIVAVHPALNAEPRRGNVKPTLLILHYTGMSSAEKAIDWLARSESRVSCHYVVDEVGGITQLVPEALRAWHAGLSHWRGETDTNSHSIGIEIQNPGHEHGYPPFSDAQMAGVIALSADICRRNGIGPAEVLAHSDIAPARKIDPGEAFPWAKLAAAGVCLWIEPRPVDLADSGADLGTRSAAVVQAQNVLASIGYGVPRTGVLCADTMTVLRGFQRRYRPARIDGRLDASTVVTLQAVAERLKQSVAAV